MARWLLTYSGSGRRFYHCCSDGDKRLGCGRELKIRKISLVRCVSEQASAEPSVDINLLPREDDLGKDPCAGLVLHPGLPGGPHYVCQTGFGWQVLRDISHFRDFMLVSLGGYCTCST